MVTSNIPRAGRANDPGRLNATFQGSIPAATKQAGRVSPGSSISRIATPASTTQNVRRPSGPADSSKRAGAGSPMTRREPPAPRPALSGRAYVGTTIPPARHTKSQLQLGQNTMLPPPRTGLFEPAKTPSLVSSSSVSTLADSPRSNIMMRKESLRRSESSTVLQTAIKLHTQEPICDDDTSPNAVFGISVPPPFSSLVVRAPETDILNLDPYSIQQPHSMPLPPLSSTPLYALTATPSTRYSPSPFSVSSTPTTMSCYSPATNATAPRPSLGLERQFSPMESRPSSARKLTSDSVQIRDARSNLPARQNSSSSGSTVKAGEDNAKLRSPIKMDNKAASRLTRSKIRIGNEDKRPATLQKKPPSVPIRPPEFAHLADASPIKRLVQQRPERPSRDNTPELVFKTSNSVVQSNMSSLPNSVSKPQSPTRPSDNTNIGARGRFGLPRKAPSRQPSPALKLSIPVTENKANDTPTSSKVNDSASTSQSSAGLEKTHSRFGLFRRGKSEPRLNTMSPEKRLRKGPMAGSGQEIYGKFGIRHRSGSSTSGNTSAGRSSSTGSTRVALSQPGSRKSSVGSKRGSVTDDFVSQRLSPVTLRGAGTIATRLDAATSSKTSSVAVTGSSLSVDGTSSSATDESSQTALARYPTSELQSKDVAEIEPNEGQAGAQDGPQYRSSSSLIQSKSRRSMIDTAPMMTSGEASRTEYHFSSHPAVNPLARKMSEPAPDVSGFASSASPVQYRPGTQNPSTTPRLTRKWNFLWTNSRSTPKPDVDIPPEAVTIALPGYLPPRQVGHYAIQDVPGNFNVDEIEKIMQEAENFDDIASGPSEPEQDDKSSSVRLGDSVLLPAPPSFSMSFPLPPRPASPKVALHSPQGSDYQMNDVPEHNHKIHEQALIEALPNVRPSRLQQVGRIPRVVSKRDRERKPPVASFSRPFDVTQPSPASNSPLVSDGHFENASTVAPNVVQHYQSLNLDNTMMPVSRILPATTALTTSPELIGNHVTTVLRSPSIKSGATTSSRRSSMAKFIAPIVIPGTQAPSSVDDVWHEYDDLLDLLSTKTPKTPKTPHTGSSLGAPFQYAEFGASPVDAPLSPVYPFDRKSFPSVPSLVRRLRSSSVRDSMTLKASRSFTSAPASPISILNVFESAIDRRASALAALTGRRSLPPASRSSGGHPRMSLPMSVPEASDEDEVQPRASQMVERKKRDSKRDSICVQTTEAQYMGFESMVNLRNSALTTSRWLSFGRVLFSPAHDELQIAGENRVLVLDGLGKDWSFYLALSYKNAMVYNLGADPPDEVGTKKPSLMPPPNHQHMHHPGLSVALPFSNGYFSAVVFRFPAIASEATYKFALGECKRVLRPGGFLEVSVLDMDMLNMGNYGRRALRSLKERIHDEDSSVSFKSMSDTVQRLLGRRGFENLNRCVVGVPAAGSIPHAKVETPAQTTGEAANISNTPSMPSLGDLMRDQSASGDDGIARMVARVARWWYSRCYESLALAHGDMTKSIWSNSALLEECEERGTSLRLMICFAQKPECAARRTNSI